MLCVLMTSWRPVVKYPGAGKLLNQEQCEIGLSGNPDAVGIGKGYRSEPGVSGELFEQHAEVCVHVSAVDAIFISVTGSIHTVLNVYTFPFLCTSPGKTGKTGKLRLFREAM